jgi:copper/silver efflux system protein
MSKQATREGAERCFRPVLMAVGMNLIGLVPVMTASGIGADVAKRIASPMFGGLVSLTVLTLFVIPVVYMLREGRLAARIAKDAGRRRAA